MRYSIIAVGNEVLSGTTKNSTTSWLMTSLESIGYEPSLKVVVPDSKSEIIKALTASLELTDIVILTGGLGPTPDDLTKEAIAKCLNLQLKESQTVLGWLREFFDKKGFEMPPSNRKQAMIPRGAEVLRNLVGTAPGISIETQGKRVILLPGPPSELEPMWEREVLPYLSVCKRLFTKDFYLLGMSESSMTTIIRSLLEREEEPFVAPYASIGQVRLRVSAHAENKTDFEEKISDIVSSLQSKLRGYLFDQSMAESLVTLLKKNNLIISMAESCTGGLISKMLTDISGVSAVFAGGVVPYSNDSKMSILGVKPDTLKQFGAVSKQIAIEMAQGSRRIYKSDIALSTTGIAGPTGGTPDKPVGLVYMGLSTSKETKVFKEIFTGNRETIRIKTAMRLLWHAINDLS